MSSRERDRTRERNRRARAREVEDAEDRAAVEEVQYREGGYRVAAAALVRWCRRKVVGGGGPRQGEPFRVARWQEDWLRGALAPGIREAGLSVARKNGKSGLIAALLLCYLCGPLNRRGWRGAVVSLNHRLSLELREQMVGLIKASGLDVGVSIFMDRIEGHRDSKVSFLAADRSTGHALGLDLAVIDEAGLMEEWDRASWETTRRHGSVFLESPTDTRSVPCTSDTQVPALSCRPA